MSGAPPTAPLTIVICTYNNAEVLAQALAHLERQTVGGRLTVPILIIDNNCTDHTAAVVDSFATRLPCLRRVVETEQGQAHARARGVDEATTEWIAFVDDDNMLAEDWVESALAFAAAHPECGAFGGRVEMEWEATPPLHFTAFAEALAELNLGPESRFLKGEQRWRLVGAGLVVRRAALLATGWRELRFCVGRSGGGLMSGDDLEMVMRIGRNGHPLAWVPACGLRHCISGSRINFAYLEKLYSGFGRAHPFLLGMKRRRSFARWMGAYARSLVGMWWRVLLPASKGLWNARDRHTARLNWLYLRGAWQGLGAIFQLPPTARLAWLGTTTPQPAPLKMARTLNTMLPPEPGRPGS